MKTKGTVSDSSYPRRDVINRGNQKQIGWRWTQTEYDDFDYYEEITASTGSLSAL